MGIEFNTEQFSKVYPVGVENTYWNRARNRIILRYVKKFKLNNLLDVGCGRGIVTSYLFKSSINVTGVDIGAPLDSDKPDFAIYYNTEAGNLPEDIRNKVESISLFDVIEHIENTPQFIERLVSRFPNLQYLMITVPARRELWSNFDTYYGHFRRYNLATIKKEMDDSGFKIISSRYFFHILYPLIRMNNLFLKNRDININALGKGLIGLFHKLLGAIFYLEIFIIPGRVRGTSIMAICEKKQKY